MTVGEAVREAAGGLLGRLLERLLVSEDEVICLIVCLRSEGTA
jgi:hypothetical protein